MSPVLLVSIAIRLAAWCWSAVLWRRLRDWRMAFLSGMLGLMAGRQMLTLWGRGDTLLALEMGHALVSELSGLLVSVMAFLAVLFVDRLLPEHTQAEFEVYLPRCHRPPPDLDAEAPGSLWARNAHTPGLRRDGVYQQSRRLRGISCGAPSV